MGVTISCDEYFDLNQDRRAYHDLQEQMLSIRVEISNLRTENEEYKESEDKQTQLNVLRLDKTNLIERLRLAKIDLGDANQARVDLTEVVVKLTDENRSYKAQNDVHINRIVNLQGNLEATKQTVAHHLRSINGLESKIFNLKREKEDQAGTIRDQRDTIKGKDVQIDNQGTTINAYRTRLDNVLRERDSIESEPPTNVDKRLNRLEKTFMEYLVAVESGTFLPCNAAAMAIRVLRSYPQ